MTQIKCILFDIGGVLVDWHQSWITKEVSDRFEVNEEKLIDAFDKYLIQLDSGKIDEPLFWKYVADHTGSSSLLQNSSESLWTTYFRKNAEPNQDVQNLAASLRENGFTIGIISNIEKVTHDVVEDWKMLEHFEYKFMSYQIGHSKPDSRVYKHVIEHLPFKEHEMLFIDDKLSNVESAQECGISSIQFIGLDDLKSSLKKFNLEI